MTIQTVDLIALRIRGASKESTVAVFKTYVNGFLQLDALFSKTVDTTKRINDGDPLLVGVFCKESEPNMVKLYLKKALTS